MKVNSIPPRIVLTGGHAATPALGTVEETLARQKDWKLYWIGPNSAMETAKIATAAEKTLHEYGVVIRKIVAGRALRRGHLFTLLKAYLKIPFGFVHAFWEVVKIRPQAVVSFGGFAALPVVFSSWLMRIPVIIHEQITGAGLANKISSPFAKKIAVARGESLKFFPKGKTQVIGNPQVAKFFNISRKPTIGKPPTLFITGGSSGSQIINEVVKKLLNRLLKDYFVIQQTGENNLEEFLDLKVGLQKTSQDRYEVFGYANPKDMADFFSKADIIISRAGANTVSDIVASLRPAILIPIPWSIGDEQTKNAQRAQETGLVTIIKQDDLTEEKLMTEITRLKANWQEIVDAANTSGYDLDKYASQKLVDLIEGVLI